MTVGNAYLNFYELAEDSERLWLPFAILLGWIVPANLLTLLRLKKIDLTGMSPSLPHLKNSSMLSNYKKDTEGGFQPNNTNKEQFDEFGSSRYCGTQTLRRGYDKLKDNGGVEKWIEEFRIDLERYCLGIPVKPVTLLFEDLSLTRSSTLSFRQCILIPPFPNFTPGAPRLSKRSFKL